MSTFQFFAIIGLNLLYFILLIRFIGNCFTNHTKFTADVNVINMQFIKELLESKK